MHLMLISQTWNGLDHDNDTTRAQLQLIHKPLGESADFTDMSMAMDSAVMPTGESAALTRQLWCSPPCRTLLRISLLLTYARNNG